MSIQQKLAKLSAPQSKNIYKRLRLFKELDAARKEHSVIWISAPAGSGKTTLVTSYLQQKKIKPLWYQIDEGDGDAASFFYYLGLAAKEISTRQTDLPQLTPEYLLGIPTFARNYFRELYSRLTLPGVLVFDNYQDVATDAALHDLLALAMTELPKKITIFIISRINPPPNYSKFKLSQQMIQLDFDSLCLTQEESKEIALLQIKKQSNKKSIDESVLDKIYHQTQGWTAGLILYCQQTQLRNNFKCTTRDFSPQTIFDYFAGELFDQADQITKNTLLRTAYFPSIDSESAKTITGNQNAAETLDTLCNQNYFTTRHTGQAISFEYHPLFREFLQSKASTILSTNDLTDLQRQSVKLLADTNHITDAANLSIKTKDWRSLVGLIVTHAQTLIQQGRFLTLADLIESLPADIVKNTPWLLFWRGVSLQPYNSRSSRNYYEEAYQKFKESTDIAGQLLAWSGVVDTYINEWGNCIPLDYWIAEIDEFLGNHYEFPSPEIEARVVVGVFTALMFRQPERTELTEWADKAKYLMEQSTDIPLKMTIGSYLALYYMWWKNRLSTSLYILNLLEPYANAANVPPLTRITWCYIKTAHCWLKTKNSESIAAMNEGLRLADQSGVYVLNCFLIGQGTWPLLTDGKLEAAGVLLDKMNQLLDPSRLIDTGQYHYLRFTEALHNNDVGQMKEHAKKALDLTRESGSKWSEGLILSAFARAHVEAGEYTEAKNLLDQSKKIGTETNVELIVNNAMITDLALAYRQNDERVLDILQTILERSIIQGFSNIDSWRNEDWANYCLLALENNIEEAFTKELIEKHNLLPPVGQLIPENWPFPIKFYTLGRFSLLIDDEPQPLTAKSAQKPMELLKCLLAFGGRQVSQEKIAEALWPDAEGDAARRSFDTTLFRLRKLLKHDHVLVLKEGLLSLDSSYVWTDNWALERVLSQLDQYIRSNEVEDIQQCQQKLMMLYKGDFLGFETDRSWSIVLKERLRSRILKSLFQLGNFWQQERHFSNVELVFDFGLKFDPLNERCYQQLIQLYVHMGKNSQAIVTYEQCRNILSKNLGVMPSEETTKLISELADSCNMT